MIRRILQSLAIGLILSAPLLWEVFANLWGNK